jgi:hypothetical protein
MNIHQTFVLTLTITAAGPLADAEVADALIAAAARVAASGDWHGDIIAVDGELVGRYVLADDTIGV